MPEEGSHCLITLIIKLHPKLSWAVIAVRGFSISSLESTVGAQEQFVGRWEKELGGSITSLGKMSSIQYTWDILVHLHVLGYKG